MFFVKLKIWIWGRLFTENKKASVALEHQIKELPLLLGLSPTDGTLYVCILREASFKWSFFCPPLTHKGFSTRKFLKIRFNICQCPPKCLQNFLNPSYNCDKKKYWYNLQPAKINSDSVLLQVFCLRAAESHNSFILPLSFYKCVCVHVPYAICISIPRTLLQDVCLVTQFSLVCLIPFHSKWFSRFRFDLL